MRLRKEHPLLSIVNQLVVDLPTPINISYFWNFGSLLGLCLGFQIITGIFLAMHYSSDVQSAFASMAHIMRDVNYGFLLRYCHANGASLFFICVYLHIGRGIYYGSYQKFPIWATGVVIYGLMMLTAFIGYVLPWGQMSFWGATVITNLVSAVPYIGDFLVQWIWGGFSVSGATLNRFFSLHYLMPFVLAGLAAAHIILLHDLGSNNPLGLRSDVDKVLFHPYFSYKDILGFIIAFVGLFGIVFFAPNILGDVENFSEANPLVTPVHIQPEWYFLFAYAILRSIPNKLGGVIAMVASILVLLLLPLSHQTRLRGLSFRPLGKMLFWFLIVTFFILTWIGSLPAEEPYITTGQVATVCYFSYFFVLFGLTAKWEDQLLFK